MPPSEAALLTQPPPAPPVSALFDEADLAVLAAQPILRGIPPLVAELVVESFAPASYAFGDEIVHEGDAPDGYYVVLEGAARALRTQHGAEVSLGAIRAGEAFGEAGLLDGTPRVATVRASSKVRVAKLEPALFGAIVRRHPEVGAALAGQARARRLGPILRQHALFAAVPAEVFATIVAELQEVDVAAGDILFHKGDAAGPLYVIVEGRLRACDERGVVLRYLRSGDLFGERSVYRGEPRAATVDAVSDGRLLSLDAAAFARMTDQHPAVRTRIDEQLALYERGPAMNVPIDFADELLPAGAEMPESNEATVARSSEPPKSLRTLPRLRRNRHVPLVRQLDMMDCGAACLAMVCRAFGRAVPIGHIRDVIGTSIDGTSLRGIQRGGEALGLDVKAVKVSKDKLDELALPAIIHWQANHWMVLDEVRADRVHVADPGMGSRWIARDAFLDDWSGFTALPSPTPKLADAPAEHASLRWLLPFVRPHKVSLGIVVALALAMAGLQMLLPMMTGRIVDQVVRDRDYGQLYVLTGSLAVLQLLALGAGLLQSRLLSTSAVQMDGASLDFISARLLRLPLRYFESRRGGDIERRLDGMRDVREFAIGNGIGVLTSVTQLIAAVVFMALTSIPLVIVWVLTTPIYLLLTRLSTKRMRPAFNDLEESFGRYRSRQLDAIAGIETVKSLGVEEGLRGRMVRDFDDLSVRMLRADRTALTYGGLVSAVTMLLLLLFLFLGALQTMNGNLTVGELIVFNSLVLLATGPLVGLLSLWDDWQNASVMIGRLQDIMEHEPEQSTDVTRRAVPTLEGRVTLTNVGFRYPSTPDTAILEGISLDVAPGTTVALVGRSGSGKSTLLKCLAGLFVATEGTIAFDGLDLHELDWRDLRRRIGLVPQRPHVFDDTIAANIGFGELDPDPQHVRDAAEIADAHDFIDRFPLGYQTRVGDGGLRLSGGQAQRLAIARSIYHRPAVVLLDEATSALDSEAERAVTANMRRLLEGRTAFIVAHRLSTVRDADLIVVLERGRIAETGTHDELLARGGLYFHLYGQAAEA